LRIAEVEVYEYFFKALLLVHAGLSLAASNLKSEISNLQSIEYLFFWQMLVYSQKFSAAAPTLSTMVGLFALVCGRRGGNQRGIGHKA
jgi:hypothetical protein